MSDNTDYKTMTVTTFKATGKYNTQHSWRVPANAYGPYDVRRSPDYQQYRQHNDTPVLVDAEPAFPGDCNVGFPLLLIKQMDVHL